jgi:2-phosphosulfolactate phosphatase
MKISTYATPQSIVDDTNTIKSRFVVVIDALRATSVIAAALSEGARCVIPVMEIEEAVKLYHSLGADRTLLCGEREGNPISGFHLGNSPFEYRSKVVKDFTLIMTTTNGTRAIHAAANAAVMALGSMLNASAVAADARESGLDVTLVCAGTRGRFTMDDVLAAGAIIDALSPSAGSMDDLSFMARDYYRRFAGDLSAALEYCSHARFLIDAGYAADVEYCMRKDSLRVVPYFEKGMVRLL